METTRKTRPLFLAPSVLVVAFVIHAIAVGCGGQTEQTSTSGETGTTPPQTTTPTDTSAGAGTAQALLAEGEAIYKQRCVICHGTQGKGDGPGAKGLNPPPRDHTNREYMISRTDEDLKQVIHDGKGAMPAWGKILTAQQIEAVLRYVRTLHGAV